MKKRTVIVRVVFMCAVARALADREQHVDVERVEALLERRGHVVVVRRRAWKIELFTLFRAKMSKTGRKTYKRMAAVTARVLVIIDLELPHL